MDSKAESHPARAFAGVPISHRDRKHHSLTGRIAWLAAQPATCKIKGCRHIGHSASEAGWGLIVDGWTDLRLEECSPAGVEAKIEEEGYSSRDAAKAIHLFVDAAFALIGMERPKD